MKMVTKFHNWHLIMRRYWYFIPNLELPFLENQSNILSLSHWNIMLIPKDAPKFNMFVGYKKYPSNFYARIQYVAPLNKRNLYTIHILVFSFFFIMESSQLCGIKPVQYGADILSYQLTCAICSRMKSDFGTNPKHKQEG